ncbi:MAG: glycosyltransferase family 39 protein, partial [Firmicutes bacterium]|nr:glycosyltransferase family 39 protein [Bacillota bacterium]
MLDAIRQEKRTERILAALMLTLGVLLRLAFLGALPYGLNQDEASAGYEAWALLTAGVDRCGKSWPVLFISWGSGQNVLMSYLAMPFIALFGLSEWTLRLPNAISGCLTLFVFWRLAYRCGGRRFGLLALFLLTVNPWHIMMSRWALESNLLPFFL